MSDDGTTGAPAPVNPLATVPAASAPAAPEAAPANSRLSNVADADGVVSGVDDFSGLDPTFDLSQVAEETPAAAAPAAPAPQAPQQPPAQAPAPAPAQPAPAAPAPGAPPAQPQPAQVQQPQAQPATQPVEPVAQPQAPAQAPQVAQPQPAPPQQPAAAPEAPPEAPVTVGTLRQQIADQSSELVTQLAETEFRIAPELMEELETNVAEALPRVLADTHLKTVQTMLGYMEMIVPQVAANMIQAGKAADQLETQFFEMFPQLKTENGQHNATIAQVASALKANNPGLDPQMLMSLTGNTVLQMAAAQPAAVPAAPAAPVPAVPQPAAPAAAPPTTAQPFVPATTGTPASELQPNEADQNPFVGIGTFDGDEGL